jgi:hypothetical protein
MDDRRRNYFKYYSQYGRSKTTEECGKFQIFCSKMTHVTRCTYGTKSRIAMAKAALSKKKKNLFTCKLDLNLRKKLVNCYIWSVALCGAETGTFRKVDQKYLDSFQMWCWRRMEKISSAGLVRNEEVLQRVKEKKNVLYVLQRRKGKWIDGILLRNCLLKHGMEKKIEVMERRGRT